MHKEEENNQKSYNSELITKIAGAEALEFISQHINHLNSNTLTLNTSSLLNFEVSPDTTYKAIINLEKTNNFRYINKFFESLNTRLSSAGLYIGCVETNQQHTQYLIKHSFAILKPFILFYYFLFKRIFPKIWITKKLYFLITKGKNRALSLAECFGRLISCGFEIIDYETINGLTYFAVIKTKVPAYDMQPSYSLLFKMNRIGKDGKLIKIYKLRTMHPYAEYLQEYVYRMNSLKEDGKIRNDFRITTWGKIFRKLWIDELPQLINFFRGEINLVGVRPLSKHYFSLYPKALQKLRTKFTPGIIPPFYADMPKTFNEILESEKKYLLKKQKHPHLTDIEYFFRCAYNIIIRNKRSS